MKNVLKDFSLSTIVAGLIAVLVGYTSSAVIVFQAATASGVSPVEAGAWLGIICVSMGLLTIYLSLKHKMPIMFAWSTAGGAILITGVAGLSLNEIIGTFVFSAFLILLCGLTGFFEKVMNRIPVAIASAMLAGVLLHFALEVFISMKTQMILSISMFICYLIGRRFFPRYNIVVVLILGMMIAWGLNLMHLKAMDFSLLHPIFIMPSFKFSSLISIGIPLFVVTMASQNLTGVTVMRSFGYDANISKLISWSGFVNLLIAPFGGFTLNLSALTAAICMGPEAHPNKDKRYTAAVSSGIIYVIIGLFSGVVVSVFAAFPRELIMTIAGLAMMNTVANGIVSVVHHTEDREAAMITFFVTASGITLLGVGAAFWGLVAGALASIIFKYKG
ncbi:MAG: benzoate/H(+) symporter BenE family transporter [Bdellovibrionales bacterium]|nr:benzoate/H(+) symporter BenE family transporter [Bdellovibrionales bacterium]